MGRLALVALFIGALVLALAKHIASAFDLLNADTPEQIGLALIFCGVGYASCKFLTDDGKW